MGDKKILYIFVPESSQVHRCNSKIYDRNEDADVNITNNTVAIANMYIRKQSVYTENRVYPYATIDDLRKDLINRVRTMAHNQKGFHPWDNMSDIELIKSAGLYSKDYQTGQEDMVRLI